MQLSNLSLALTAIYGSGFAWPSLFANGTPGFRINIEEAIRLNKAAIGSKTSGFTPEELAACVAFQDSAGTLPVTAMEQPLGYIKDLSGNGNHFLQPSNTASRPIVSRRVNQLTNTGFLLGAVNTLPTDWIERGNVTGRIIEDAAAPSGRAMRVTVTAGGGIGSTSDVRITNSGLVVGGTYKVSILAKRVSGESNLIVAAAGGVTPGSFPLSDSYAWYEGTFVATGAANSVFFGGSVALTYDVAAVDCRLQQDTINLPPYQRVTSSTDYDESGFPAYARFDGLDDWLETAGTVDMTSTDEVTVIAGVTKLSDAGAGSVIEFGEGISEPGRFNVSAATADGDASRRTYGMAVYADGVEATGGASYYESPDKRLIAALFDTKPLTRAEQRRMRLNGVPQTLIFTGGTLAVGNFGAQKFYIGRRGGYSQPFNGRIYGVTVVGKLLPDGQLAAAEQAERNLGRLY